MGATCPEAISLSSTLLFIRYKLTFSSGIPNLLVINQVQRFTVQRLQEYEYQLD
jgi:hypothetical protein